jgi:O-acetyl-ADP-ribose deacetylase
MGFARKDENMFKDKIKVIKGDITKLKVDAIVNAANNQLVRGAGVCGAIHRAAGPELEAECKTLGGCDTGEAKITKGYHLPAKYVIHTVGPIWYGGGKGEADLLAACYANTLKLAVEKKIKSIAFSAISTGVYGYPIPQATAVAVQEVIHFLKTNSELNEVDFVCFDDNIYQTYQEMLEKS